ncbi:hypothetical protein WICPIJ_008082 [Wickerhamomyces pijperi]|uniref:Uncharacterized protein n=1 Tax=Wickerhamomyces pijperi TaxID=599730 RepID=A0A9P8TJ88_WICPI|nr:hypothetical protein WICPIJ_008082 [Wickerhamomyces pijperi]
MTLSSTILTCGQTWEASKPSTNNSPRTLLSEEERIGSTTVFNNCKMSELDSSLVVSILVGSTFKVDKAVPDISVDCNECE